ncbi:MAG: RlmE family RNA methyltransferase [Holosporales bacterium]|jgi:23S rRNA (uridine2552-2'-O)-methyltransferase|nr:RlmE family RNA methyltransferase [Holosporales bacterium]
MKERVKNKRLKKSSRSWIERQLNDQFVLKAKKEGYRSRAAFKILEIQNKFNIMNNKSIVIDLGAAPGGWSQVVSQISKKVIAIDLLDMEPIPNVDFIKSDFLDESSIDLLKKMLPGRKADVVMSDMSPSTCGIKKVDHLRIINLVEAVYEFCQTSLNQGGMMIAKLFQGGADIELLSDLKKNFNKVIHFKPNSSRKESSEIYLIAVGYKGTSSKT